MGLIYFLEELFGKIVFSIGKYKFEGIRPLRYIEFPWKNLSGMGEYLKILEKEDTPYSYKKFIYWDEQRHYEMMHILFSRGFICQKAGIGLFLLSVIFMISRNETALLIIIVSSIILLVLSEFFKARVKKYYKSIEFSHDFFNLTETWPDNDDEENEIIESQD
jgi:hypothetical protein